MKLFKIALIGFMCTFACAIPEWSTAGYDNLFTTDGLTTTGLLFATPAVLTGVICKMMAEKKGYNCVNFVFIEVIWTSLFPILRAMWPAQTTVNFSGGEVGEHCNCPSKQLTAWKEISNAVNSGLASSGWEHQLIKRMWSKSVTKTQFDSATGKSSLGLSTSAEYVIYMDNETIRCTMIYEIISDERLWPLAFWYFPTSGLIDATCGMLAYSLDFSNMYCGGVQAAWSAIYLVLYNQLTKPQNALWEARKSFNYSNIPLRKNMTELPHIQMAINSGLKDLEIEYNVTDIDTLHIKDSGELISGYWYDTHVDGIASRVYVYFDGTRPKLRLNLQSMGIMGLASQPYHTWQIKPTSSSALTCNV